VALHLAMAPSHRATPTLPDFSIAFWVVTAISAAATIWNLQFSKTAGEEMSGRAPRAAPPASGASARRV